MLQSKKGKTSQYSLVWESNHGPQSAGSAQTTEQTSLPGVRAQ